MNAILIVTGVVAIFAAIVGGGVKLQNIEVGNIVSVWRQLMLGLFGLILLSGRRDRLERHRGD